MILTVTVLSLGMEAITTDPMATLARAARHVVQRACDYDDRGSFAVDVEDAHAACEEAWKRYQNIDRDHVTPDRGRSLMVGDMVRVTDAQAQATWWICCSIGWTQTVAPGDARLAISKPNARD